MQAKAAGSVKSTEEIRNISRNSCDLEEFKPSFTEEWSVQYIKYLKVYIE